MVLGPSFVLFLMGFSLVLLATAIQDPVSFSNYPPYLTERMLETYHKANDASSEEKLYKNNTTT